MIENNEELMRSLQPKLQSSGNVGTDPKHQAKLLLQASNKALLADWDQWLTDVTLVYNDKLSNAIISKIERGMTAISDKSSLIDQNQDSD